MDIKVSYKNERMLQPSPAGYIEKSDIFEIYLNQVYENGVAYISDVDILDTDGDEAMSRTIFSALRQRGSDPITPAEGIDWAGALMQETPFSVLTNQINRDVRNESTAVSVQYSVNENNMVSLHFKAVTI